MKPKKRLKASDLEKDWGKDLESRGVFNSPQDQPSEEKCKECGDKTNLISKDLCGNCWAMKYIKSRKSKPPKEEEVTQEWEERFDYLLRDLHWTCFSELKDKKTEITNWIKTNFISRKELLGKVEGLRKTTCDCSCDPKKGECLMFSYNNCLSDLKEIIEQ